MRTCCYSFWGIVVKGRNPQGSLYACDDLLDDVDLVQHKASAGRQGFFRRSQLPKCLLKLYMMVVLNAPSGFLHAIQLNLELLLVSDSAERCTNAKHLTFYAAEDHHLCAALMLADKVVENSEKRYVPHAEDSILGIVVDSRSDNFLVDIKGPAIAFLPVLAFEGGTRRNIPRFEVGNIS
ncbi:hypothetical protein ACSQ67_005285 [Phaseolus vulgaris]